MTLKFKKSQAVYNQWVFEMICDLTHIADERGKRITELEEIVEQLQISRSAEMLSYNVNLKRQEAQDKELASLLRDIQHLNSRLRSQEVKMVSVEIAHDKKRTRAKKP